MNMSVSDLTSAQPNTSLDLYANQDALDKDSFLKLLVTQLRNQDPLDPMQNTEFIAQLAQFSSLEQMQNVSTGVNDLKILMQSVNNSFATEMIGKDVKFTGNSFRLTDDQDANVYFAIAEDATVKINIFDDKNNLVKTIVQSDMTKGTQKITWDGLDAEGDRAAAGRYTYTVSATDSQGAKVEAVTFAVDHVTGLKFDSGNAILMMAGKEIYLSNILEILEPIQ
jgi:flagellar basal-body rod modification protein FlgD